MMECIYRENTALDIEVIHASGVLDGMDGPLLDKPIGFEKWQHFQYFVNKTSF